MSGNDQVIGSKLAAALVAAQKEARAQRRDEVTDAGPKYRYTSSETMIDEGKLALGRNGLALVQGGSEILSTKCAEATNDKGNRSFWVALRVDYMLVHESGETLRYSREWPAIEQKGRPLDKAVGGALTSSLGYALRDLLQIPRDDELAEMDRRDDSDHEPAKKEQPREAPSVARTEPRPSNDAAQSGSDVDSYADIARMIRALDEKGEPLFSTGEIEKAIAAAYSSKQIGEDGCKSLRFIFEADGAKTKDDIARIGAAIRASGMPKPFVDSTLDAIEPDWLRVSGAAA